MAFFRKKRFFVLLFLVALMAAWFFAPWTLLLEKGLMYVVASQGFGKAQLHIESVSRDEISLSGIAVEGDTPLSLKSLNVKFFPLTIGSASMDFQGGTVEVHDVPIAMYGKAPIDAVIKVNHVSLDALMDALTGQKATATGRVSGTLPVTLTAEGTVIVHKGNLKSEAPGNIALQPEAIPGDNQQVALVRDVMKNLNYQLLSIDMNSDDKQKLSVTLHVEGNNPDMYEGRPVKLNVNLSGDVLELIQQSLLTLDPQKLLEQSRHEK